MRPIGMERYYDGFAIINDLIIMSKQFQHKKIHLGTCTAPGQMLVNQIHHVMTNHTTKDLINVRPLRDLNIECDHFMVKTLASYTTRYTHRKYHRLWQK